MLCENCKKNKATLHITDKVDGEYVERHLCPDCAGSLSDVSPDDTIFIPFEVLKKLIHQLKDEHIESLNKIKCPKCGQTWQNFVQTGKFGCANDYELFRMDVSSLLKKLHDGKFVHTGKVPHQKEDQVKKIEIRKLEEEMQEMVKKENYEKAAEIRDQLKELKK